MIFIAVFIFAFMGADYLITGSVTNTWVGIAVFMGLIVSFIRRFVFGLLNSLKF